MANWSQISPTALPHAVLPEDEGTRNNHHDREALAEAGDWEAFCEGGAGEDAERRDAGEEEGKRPARRAFAEMADEAGGGVEGNDGQRGACGLAEGELAMVP